jgi:hypothetical protein
VVQDILGLIGCVLWIERHKDRTNLANGKYRKEKLSTVRQEERYSVTFCDAEAMETVRDAIYFALKLSITPTPLCKRECDSVRVARYSLG